MLKQTVRGLKQGTHLGKSFTESCIFVTILYKNLSQFHNRIYWPK